MAEYIEVNDQLVALNNPIVFTASIPCPRGYVLHEDGTGTFTLRGVTNNCFARYQITYVGNVTIPEGGTVTPVAVSLAVNGETRPSSLSIANPEVGVYENVVSTAIITVPKGCCFNVSVRYVSGVTDGTTTPTPAIEVANSNLTIARIA